MEFHIYNVQGQKRILEAHTLEQTDKAIILRDNDGDVIWWVNPNAVAFIEYKKEEKKKLELVKP